ncbi:MAG: hypothetical protein LAT82_01675 [Nanoarchaeota archaeon]|nr:hypothetical protein [Nanoarchaeota archaeon]
MESLINVNKKTSVIFTILLSMLLIAGCTGGVGGGDNVRTASIGGSSANNNGAVVLNFVENNPPSQMFKGERYDFAFVISNYQMHEVDDLRLRITGFDRGNVNGLPEQDTVSSIPSASEVAGAGIKTDHFYSDVVVDDFTREFPLNPRIRYCYTQTSFRKQEICVPSLNNVCGRDVVVANTVETNGPFNFRVQNVNSIGGTIRIDFEVTNRLGGRVVDECFGREGFASEYSGVVARLGTVEGNCRATGTNDYLFANGRANFFCEFSRTGDDSYPAQLYVEAQSLYEQEKRLNIMVRDPSYGVG